MMNYASRDNTYQLKIPQFEKLDVGVKSKDSSRQLTKIIDC